jgi:hypothetical protein
MTKLSKHAILLGTILALPLAPSSVVAQSAPAKAPAKAPADDLDALVELARKDLRAGKADIVGKTMKLDAGQAAAFWPLYKQYEAERQAVGDERLAVIQDFAEHYDSMNDAKATGLLERSFGIEDKRMAIEKKYKGEMLKVLPGKVVARFFQVDRRVNNLIDLKLSSQIPLVE